MALQTHTQVVVRAEHLDSYNEPDRCPCGSSLFRIFGESDMNLDKEKDEVSGTLEWWQICAVCGHRSGGFTETFSTDEKGELDSKLRKYKLDGML